MKRWRWLLKRYLNVVCWRIVSVKVLFLFIASISFECAYAGRTFYFNPDQMCKDIDAASTWRDLVPPLAEQVRLFIYCAERTELGIQEVEFYRKDWDEPLTAAGKPKTVYQSLIEAISNLGAQHLLALDNYVGQEKKERRKGFEELCRSWLMMQGKIPKNSKNPKNCKDFLEWIVQVKTNKNNQEKALEADVFITSEKVKKEFIEAAEKLRCFHEMETKGMNSFMYYLSCAESLALPDRGDESKVAAFCRSLTSLINGHFDAYGVGSLLAFKKNEELFFITDIKDLLKDSVGRFSKLLTLSYEQVEEKEIDGEEFLVPTSEGRISKFLEKLSEKQKEQREFLLRRELFAGGVLSLIEEKSVVKIVSRTGVREVMPVPKVKRSPNWHPPTEEEKAQEAAKEAVRKAKAAVGILWERFQLIDEVTFVADVADSHMQVGDDLVKDKNAEVSFCLNEL